MKKFVFLILAVLFLFTTKVSASSLCSYKEQAEINQKAANIKVSYEIKEETIHFDDNKDATNKYFEVSIFNITEDFYVVVKNNVNDKEMTFTIKDVTNGQIKFRWDEMESVTNFTIQIYTTSKTSCPDEKFKTFYLTTPRYNEFYEREICHQLSEFYLCQEFVTFSEINEGMFLSKLYSYQNDQIDETGEDKTDGDNDVFSDKLIEFLINYKWYIGGILVIIIAGVVVLIRVRAKKQRDLSL